MYKRREKNQNDIKFISVLLFVDAFRPSMVSMLFMGE